MREALVRADAERAELARLAGRQLKWTQPQLRFLDLTKKCLIGSASRLARRRHKGDSEAACANDCYRRASMLEPLVRDLFERSVPGDFLAAGVLRGGIPVYLAALIHTAACHLFDASGNCRSLDRAAPMRSMWVADSLPRTLPGTLTPYVSPGARRRRRRLPTLQRRQEQQAHANSSLSVVQGAFASCLGPRPSAPVRYLRDFFAKPPSGTSVGRLALLRIDTDVPARVRSTLDVFYPQLSVGGYVVFDDWKLPRTQEVIRAYRRAHNISSPMLGTVARQPAPFDSLDPMVFWKKDAVVG